MDKQDLQERLERIEGKLDAALEKHHAVDKRVVKLESQAGFLKWGLGLLGSILLFLAERIWGKA